MTNIIKKTNEFAGECQVGYHNATGQTVLSLHCENTNNC